MRTHGGWPEAIIVALAAVLMASAGGCASSGEDAGKIPVTAEAGQLGEMRHDVALQHYVDGSVFELKGDYAQAALEYQEALRFERDPAMYFALAKCYTALNKAGLAVEAAREAMRMAPENIDYRRMLADLLATTLDLDGAATQYEQIIARDSSNIDVWFNLARIYQQRNPQKALTFYKRITEHFGPQWDVLLQVADLYNKSGHFEEAADALKQMSAIDPGNKELKHTLAQTYVRANRLSDALATEKELMEDEPANLGYRIEVGGILLAQKEYDRAALLFDPILNSDSVAADAQTRVAELYFGQLGKDSTLLPLAQSVIERVRDAHPADWRPYWFLGGVGSMKKDDSLAARNFRKVTELAGWNADGWVFLSSIYVSKNRFAEALPILEAAIKVVPDDFRVNFLLGVAYNRSGRNQEAALTLEKARQINPRDIDAIGQLALVYEQLKQQDEADSLYEEALRLDPHNHLILNNYSYSLAERDVQLDRALEMAKTAVDAEPGLASYLDTIGWVYYRLGRYEQAENYVKKAVTSGEASAVVFEHLGDIYYKLNKLSEALEQWNAALKLDQNNAVLREKINRGSL